MKSFLDCTDVENPHTSDSTPDIRINDQQRSAALQYARSIQYQKSMQEKVLDLIVSTVDLPSNPIINPARPSASDVTLFKHALGLFQANDLDDMILERNIYEKCGYALCSRPNLKQNEKLRDSVFQCMKIRSFNLNTKEELEKWCSLECAERAWYVRLQLGIEPAWLRSIPVKEVELLEESGRKAESREFVSTGQDRTSSSHTLASNQSEKVAIEDRMQALSTQCGDKDSSDMSEVVLAGVKEKDTTSTPQAPRKSSHGNDTVEGYKPMRLHFGRGSNGKSEGGTLT